MASSGQQSMPFGYDFDQFLNQAQPQHPLQPSGPPLLDDSEFDQMQGFFEDPQSSMDLNSNLDLSLNTGGSHGGVTHDGTLYQQPRLPTSYAAYGSLMAQGQDMFSGQPVPRTDHGRYDNSGYDQLGLGLQPPATPDGSNEGANALLHMAAHAARRPTNFVLNDGTRNQHDMHMQSPYATLARRSSQISSRTPTMSSHIPNNITLAQNGGIPQQANSIYDQTASPFAAPMGSIGSSTVGGPSYDVDPDPDHYGHTIAYKPWPPPRPYAPETQPRPAYNPSFRSPGNHANPAAQNFALRRAMEQNRGKAPAAQTHAYEPHEEAINTSEHPASNKRRRTQSAHLFSPRTTTATSTQGFGDENAVSGWSSSPPNNSDDQVGSARKRRKSSAGSSARRNSQRLNLTEDQKRGNHIKSEKKRRDLINEGYETLTSMVPNLRQGGFSKSAALQEMGRYLESLVEGNARAEERIKAKENRAYGLGHGHGHGHGTAGGKGHTDPTERDRFDFGSL